MTLPATTALLPLLLLGMSACSGPPDVLLDTPTGVTPIYTPTPQAAMPGGSIAPPPGMMPPPSSAPTGSRNGSYTGTAFPLETGGGLCINTLTVSNFRVNGNAVRFGGFRGRIDANDGLQMVYGNRWIIGQFEGPTFHGQLDVPGSFGAPGCTYMLNLQRTGR